VTVWVRLEGKCSRWWFSGERQRFGGNVRRGKCPPFTSSGSFGAGTTGVTIFTMHLHRADAHPATTRHTLTEPAVAATDCSSSHLSSRQSGSRRLRSGTGDGSSPGNIGLNIISDLHINALSTMRHSFFWLWRYCTLTYTRMQSQF